MDWTETRVRDWSRLADMGARIVEAQRGTLLLWMPVGIGTGIGAYFSLRFEPGLLLYAALMAMAIAALLLFWRVGPALGWSMLTLALIVAGFLDAGARAHLKAAPILRGHYYGPVEGRLIAIDRAANNRLRLTLDRVVLANYPTSRTPHKVRVSLHYITDRQLPIIGSQVILTASLAAPSGPAEPGGFDFQRYAWFRDLGAVGYSRSPVLEIAPPDQGGWAIRLVRLRRALAASIRSRIAGQDGAFAAAILTGDRSAVAPESLLFLRNSNLAHLLAISGLHMGLLSGFIFALVRYGLALIPYIALRFPIKKIAAIAAFGAAIAYLFLSGANVATQRAFVMVTVALLAVLLNRRALTLRAVAMAAVLVLLLRPESLIEAGFQMSFAATTALVAVFEAMQMLPKSESKPGKSRVILRWFGALVLSSTVAGLATAPISAFHFNRVAEFGLLANLASVPVMGFVVMPAAVVAVLTTPLGISAPFWAIMGAGVGWILDVARWVSSLDGAVLAVVKPGTSVLVLITSGALALILLRGRVRLAGFAPVLMGFWLWGMAGRPDILLSANGSLLGINGPSGRWLNKVSGNGFTAKNWLANDGDMASQEQASTRQAPANGQVLRYKTKGVTIVYSREKMPDIRGLCQGSALVILPRISGHKTKCTILTASDLRCLGAISVSFLGQTPKIIGARQFSGQRLWSR